MLKYGKGIIIYRITTKGLVLYKRCKDVICREVKRSWDLVPPSFLHLLYIKLAVTFLTSVRGKTCLTGYLSCSFRFIFDNTVFVLYFLQVVLTFDFFLRGFTENHPGETSPEGVIMG